MFLFIIDYIFNTLTYSERIMFLGRFFLFLFLIISFIFALIIKFKAVPDIERRHEVIFVLPTMMSTGIVSFKIANFVAIHVFHRYIKSKLDTKKNTKIYTYDFSYKCIHQIKYDIYGENKINIFLCCICGISLYLFGILLVGLLTLTIFFDW